MNNVIEIKNLIKIYGRIKAVNDISFHVEKGEVFGLLGENGAGKTTTLEIIEGLRKPTHGNIKVLGHDTSGEVNHIKEKIGVQLQASAYYNYLTLSEILHLFGNFYHKRIDPDKLLKEVGLRDKSQTYVSSLSGGQKQRFSIIAALVNDPKILFLDEPTTGLDPLARRNLWELITKIKKQGKTIILTTHYMEEAEILCDRIAIMEKGKILAMDKTYKLVERAKCPFKINIILKDLTKQIISGFSKFCKINRIPGKQIEIELLLDNKEHLNDVIKLIQEIKPESFTIKKATLEDLFIQLTGKTIEE